MNKYGIGITTYRDKKSENFDSVVYTKVKKGRIFDASKRVNQIVRDSIDWSTVKEYKGYPALGVYEGGHEPASHIYISTKGYINPQLYSDLKRFRKTTNQDSILLYKFVKTGGNPVLEINIGHGHSIPEIQELISRSTNGKLGGYITYIYALHRIVIVNVKEFDGLSPTQFRKYIPAIKRVLKPYDGKITVKQATVKVI